MTEADRQQERPGAGDAGGGQRHKGYREAPEFARRGRQAVRDGNTLRDAARVQGRQRRRLALVCTRERRPKWTTTGRTATR